MALITKFFSSKVTKGIWGFEELSSEMIWSSRSKLKSCESTAIDYPSFSSCFVNQQARYLDNNLRQQTLIEAQTEAQRTQQVSEQVRKAAVRKDLVPFA